MITNPSELVNRIIELSGGKEKLNSEMDENLSFINDKWNQDTDAIGRILRAHLFVEFFLNKYIGFLNPNLGDLQAARLTFSQKVSLMENYSDETKELSTGIKRLNKVRNRLAHQLKAEVDNEDKESFLSLGSFKHLRDALAKPEKPSNDPLDVLEDFARHVGSRLRSMADPNDLSKRISQAISELSKEA